MAGLLTPGMRELIYPLAGDLRMAVDDPLAGGAPPQTAFFTLETLLATLGTTTVANTRTELATLAREGTIFLLENPRQGIFYWSPLDWSSAKTDGPNITNDPLQGVLIASNDDPTGATGAWVRLRAGTFANIEWFGAVDYAHGDATAAIQAALNWSGAERGECYVPMKTFKQTAQLQMTQACWFHGSGNWETTLGATGDSTNFHGSRLRWDGVSSPSLAQILVESNPQGTTLFHPRVSDLVVYGAALVGYGVWISASITPVVHDIHAEGHLSAGVAFIPRGGLSTVGPTWDRIYTSTRGLNACVGASGIIMDAFDASSFNTGGHGGYLRAVSTADGTGWGIRVGNQDALLIDKIEIQGFANNEGGERGQAIYFMYDPAKGGGASRKHYVTYFAGGTIKTDAGCYGINIRAGSEATYLDIDPASQLTLSVFDQSTGDQYETLSYKFTDEHDLTPTDAILTGATASTLNGISAVRFANAASDSALWAHLAKPEWNHGQICGIRVVYGSDTNESGANYYWALTITCPRTNGTTAIQGNTLEFFQTQNFIVPAVTNGGTLYSADCEFALPVDYKKGCAITVNVQRLGNDPLDTSTAAMKITGVRVLYKSDGPNSTHGEDPHTTNGKWETGAWSLETGYYDYIGGYFPFVSNETETNTIIAALVPAPTAFQAKIINYVVKSFKDAGLWAKLDLLYLLAEPEQAWSLVNWKVPGTHNLTLVGAPTFVRNQGWIGTTGGHLSTGVNWSGLSQYTQNSCHAGAFIYNQAQSATTSVFGAPVTVSTSLVPRTTGDLVSARLNSTVAQTEANTDSRGSWILNRTGAVGFDIWARMALLSTETVASIAPVAEEILILAGVSGSNTTFRVSAFHCGAGLNATELAELSRIISYYVGHLRG